MPERLGIISNVRSLVVKLGTQLLAGGAGGRLDAPFMAAMAAQVAALRAKRQVQVTLVSSGAIGAGLAELKLPKRPPDLARLQAVAAVGQRRLMDAWGEAFEPHGIPVAQVLLTREDVDARGRYLNLRNTIHAVHELGAIPVINENDTISTDELVKISFGDNDLLAATVATALRADLLVLLTVVDGLLDGEGRVVSFVDDVDEARRLVRAGEKSALGKGGMHSKLEAAELVTDSGEAFVVANGRAPDVLGRLLDGEELGTLVVPARAGSGAPRRRAGKGRWIGTARPAGTIVVDAGAARVLVERNVSLLPAGVVRAEGTFARGDVVSIRTADGAEIARGLTNYGSADIEQIRGRKTSEVRHLLGERAYDELVHRDNLVIC